MALGLGANLPSPFGPPDSTLEQALAWLAPLFGPLQVAPIHRTAPVSPIPQPDYLNTAAVGITDLAADEVLAVCKLLEMHAGRRPRLADEPRLGPRPLDVDLLILGDEVHTDPWLTVPHPRLAERRFVLEPLVEIAPGLAVPPDGRTVAELLGESR